LYYVQKIGKDWERNRCAPNQGNNNPAFGRKIKKELPNASDKVAA
jgi:hypothetical protein